MVAFFEYSLLDTLHSSTITSPFSFTLAPSCIPGFIKMSFLPQIVSIVFFAPRAAWDTFIHSVDSMLFSCLLNFGCFSTFILTWRSPFGPLSLWFPYAIFFCSYFFTKGEPLPIWYPCRNLYLLGDFWNVNTCGLAFFTGAFNDQSNAIASGAFQVHHDWVLSVYCGARSTTSEATSRHCARLCAIASTRFTSSLSFELKFLFNALDRVEEANGNLSSNILAFTPSSRACGVGFVVHSAFVLIDIILKLVKRVLLEAIAFPASHSNILIIVLTPLIFVN